ncbi:hypothetical protein HXX76_011589 [Chlamydomonas incerta]|uniref:Uncharacterized protein n=1 Tax=Chlamydomonas incerta TaxID=51695 RepID=A0A835VUK6_CHLIN|nr:hypothetical protein HXX76_011589 [Chlamydomonas incerta]|eukprot:KAG2428470.1 hypothetical protein HXX76_011589 [Chlamydomonas incerta]
MYGHREEFLIIASCPGDAHNDFKKYDGKYVRFCPVNYKSGTNFANHWKDWWHHYIEKAVQEAHASGAKRILLVAIDDGHASHIYCKEERDELAMRFGSQGKVMTIAGLFTGLGLMSLLTGGQDIANLRIEYVVTTPQKLEQYILNKISSL